MARSDVPGGPPAEHYFATAPAGPEHLREMPVLLAGRPVRVTTADGVFSADRLDPGTAVLLRTVPQPPSSGALLDLGCGWGPIALSLGMLSPQAQVWAVDRNARAVDLVRRNAQALSLTSVRAVLPEELPGDIAFDAIWSNPPIRIGKTALHELLLTYLPRLRPGGQAFLVVQRHLGADSLQTWLAGAALGSAFTISRVASSRGYRVLRVRRDDGTHPAMPA